MTADESAYATFIGAAADARKRIYAREPELEPIDARDAEAYCAMLLEGALQFVHADPAQPVFAPWTTPTRRWVDNGLDSQYRMAPVDGRRRYRITGIRRDECYLALTLYAGSPGHPEQVVLNVNHRDLDVMPGGSFTYELDPPADACYVISRHYFTDPARDSPGSLTIESLGEASFTHDGDRAHRWMAAADFLRAMTAPASPGRQLPPYVSSTPNKVGDPSAWRTEQGGGRGTPDQVYALGPYNLDEDEALVMNVRFPSCVYASAALWNRFSQTIDRRFHRSTINHTEAAAEADGSVRVVIAHRDPGVANWLDTGGRRRGTVFWRFLLADAAPPPIASEVVHLDDLRRK